MFVLSLLVLSAHSIDARELVGPCILPEIEDFGFSYFDGAADCKCESLNSYTKWKKRFHEVLDPYMVDEEDKEKFLSFLQLDQFFSEGSKQKCSNRKKLEKKYKSLRSKYSRNCMSKKPIFSEKMCKQVLEIDSIYKYDLLSRMWSTERAAKTKKPRWSLMMGAKAKRGIRQLYDWCRQVKQTYVDHRMSLTGCGEVDSVVKDTDWDDRRLERGTERREQMAAEEEQAIIDKRQRKKAAIEANLREKERAEYCRNLMQRAEPMPSVASEIIAKCVGY